MRRLSFLCVLVLLITSVGSVSLSTPARAATCTSSVGPGIPPPSNLPSGIPGFHAAWYGQSGYPTLCPGDRATSVVAYYNTGSLGWVSGAMGQVAYLGTWGPDPGQDASTRLGGDGTNLSPNTGWPRYNRIAIQPAPYVGPGQVAWFQFSIQAPATPGYYKLYLRPLIEGSTWLEDYGVYWSVTVLNQDGTLPPAPVRAAEAGCREWPPELNTELAKLLLLDQLCLLPELPEPSTCGLFNGNGCFMEVGQYAGVPSLGIPGMYWPRNTVWVRYPNIHATAHETCHAHQQRLAVDAGLGLFDRWDQLPEGSEFVQAWAAFQTQNPQGFAAWNENRSQDFENGAEVCASWYYPNGSHNTALYPQLAIWAQKWLPK